MSDPTASITPEQWAALAWTLREEALRLPWWRWQQRRTALRLAAEWEQRAEP